MGTVTLLPRSAGEVARAQRVTEGEPPFRRCPPSTTSLRPAVPLPRAAGEETPT